MLCKLRLPSFADIIHEMSRCIPIAPMRERTTAEGAPGANSVEVVTDLTIAWLSNPNTRVAADGISSFLRKMHEAVTALSLSSSLGAVPE